MFNYGVQKYREQSEPVTDKKTSDPGTYEGSSPTLCGPHYQPGNVALRTPIQGKVEEAASLHVC